MDAPNPANTTGSEVPELLVWGGAIGGICAAFLVIVYWIYQCCKNHSLKKGHTKQMEEVRGDLTQLMGRVEILIDNNDQVQRATTAAAKEATTVAVEAATKDALEIVSRQCQHGMDMSKELSVKMEKVVDSLSGVMLQGTEHLCNAVRTTVGKAAAEATETAHTTAQEQWEVAFKQMSSASTAATEHARVAGDACTKAAGEFQQLVIDAQDLTKAAVNDISSVQRTAQQAVALSNKAAATATGHMDRLASVLNNTSSVTADAVTAVKDAQDEMIRSIQCTMNDMNSRGAQQLDETMREVMRTNVQVIDRTLRDLSNVAVTVKDLDKTRKGLDAAVAELQHIQQIQASVTEDYLSMAGSQDEAQQATWKRELRKKARRSVAPGMLTSVEHSRDRDSNPFLSFDVKQGAPADIVAASREVAEKLRQSASDSGAENMSQIDEASQEDELPHETRFEDEESQSKISVTL